MKLLDIALKDLVRYFRSGFALVMMFVAPLLITGLLYFAFGNMGSGGDAPDVPAVRLQVANLDQPAAAPGLAAGELLVQLLQSETLADLLQLRVAADEASARAAVDNREADVALIVPPGFSAAAELPGREATVTLYHDPTLTLGPGLVKAVVGAFVDTLAGAKITVQVAADQLSAQGIAMDEATAEAIARRYIDWAQSVSTYANRPALTIRAPSGEAEAAHPIRDLLSPMFAAMMIFFVFFTGANSAQSIIHEDEEGTLGRLFTTPTPHSVALGGKLVAVLLILIGQTTVLLLASALAFGIRWGEPLTVTMAVVGLVTAASGFGVFVISLIKNSRQVGPVLGGVLTLAGMFGGLITGDPSRPGVFDSISRALPQGWALRCWKLALAGAGPTDVLLPTVVLLALGLAFFAAAVLIFRKRFA